MKRGNRDFKRNTDGLKATAAHKAESTRERVLEAVDRLLKEGQAINFNSVTVAAGVSRSYLYGDADLRARIEAHRQIGPPLKLVSGPVKEVSRSDRSKDMLLAAKDIKIKELEAELRRVKDEAKKLHGKLYEALNGKGKINE